MSNYDRRSARTVRARKLGTLGMSLDQLSAVVREELNLPPETDVNVQFGPVTSGERELYVPFSGFAGGKSVAGKVTFRVLESSNRQWGGSAILLEGSVELG
jgi:hypothetical protein